MIGEVDQSESSAEDHSIHGMLEDSVRKMKGALHSRSFQQRSHPVCVRKKRIYHLSLSCRTHLRNQSEFFGKMDDKYSAAVTVKAESSSGSTILYWCH